MSQSLNSAHPPGLVRLFGTVNVAEENKIEVGRKKGRATGRYEDSREALIYEFWPV